jgi:hypothetical protein
MGIFQHLCEDLRTAVDDQGAKGCYKKSVVAYSRMTGIPQEALWAAVDGILQGFDEEKMLKKLKRTWGGHPGLWMQWFEIAKTRPDCSPGDDR